MTDFFAGARPGREVTRGQATFELPILYHRDDTFALFFAADPAAVRARLPSDRLHPVCLPGGRAVVAVAAFNYIDTSIGPYGEVGVVVPAVHGHRPLVGLLPGVLEARYPGFGNVVLHLPVTKRTARDAGRGEWGYTKFVADMAFTITPEAQRCRMSEGARHILTLHVPRCGVVMRDEKPLVTYSVKQGALVRTVIPQRGTVKNALRPRGAFLSLGDHRLSDELRELRLSAAPFMSRYYVERAAILPAGEIVERGVAPLDGLPGKDREFGEHTVDYQ